MKACVNAERRGTEHDGSANHINRSSLWCEWICAHLALALGLPIPPFSLVQIDETLLQELPRDWRVLGCLPAFGSRQHAHTGWLELGIAGRVPEAMHQQLEAIKTASCLAWISQCSWPYQMKS